MAWVGDQIRWGPIWGGVVVTLAVMIVLGVLGAALGLAPTDEGAVGAEEVAWGIFTAVAAFFIGGYVAGQTSAVSNAAMAALNGAMVWALALVGALFLVAAGIGAAVGLVNAFGVSEGAAQFFDSDDSNRLWWTFAAMMVGLIVASIGGLLGTPKDDEHERHSTREVETVSDGR